eukprot:895423-Rhodomonas_salina.4
MSVRGWNSLRRSREGARARVRAEAEREGTGSVGNDGLGRGGARGEGAMCSHVQKCVRLRPYRQCPRHVALRNQ